MTFQIVDNYIDTNLDESIEELTELCAIPSIAAQNRGIQECAGLVSRMLTKRGFETEIMSTGGSPVVYAERKGKIDKTLIFYNHYDVQPAEPLELWDSPPFEATLRNGKLFARGSSDDKGHFTSRLLAIDAILATDGELPCNIKFLIEGEEEIGSINLTEFIKKHKEKLAADVCIWETGGVNHFDSPIEFLGMRGVCFFELEVETTNRDVHSGIGGTIFPNAAWRLVWALNTLKNEDETIKIPNFYDNVIPPSRDDIEMLSKLPAVMEDYKSRFGVDNFLKNTDEELQLKIQEVFEPSCTICGITSGFQGEGSKTILPAKASAKIDFRIVPNQTPEEILQKLQKHLIDQGFEDVKVNYLGGVPPGRTDPNHPFIDLVMDAAINVYGEEMVKIPMLGWSGPNHAILQHLNVPVATSGIGYPGNRTHSPNENVRLDLYAKGAKHITRILNAFGKLNN
jgi:acetylornithine deacetylase/succinyl-diaminopimelate desuccinylase-like protein